ncbi:alpha/beta hydrolase [Pseudoblastomonas halimionae]|uniref:Alpha/beta fold hydrolase n=1 Tax=Alteriqipengyuania halimionae TaxID=1926630 RepID=A0A6I4U306_9SPHN|nr:alpha/beta fold hydrolase [Alteriqipengyuania halimionae]MXP10096.1 alpha/beta fold hydrolase [Alteriqipengyuania halimionae]
MKFTAGILVSLALSSAALAGEPIATTHDGIAAPLHGTLEGTLGEGAPAVLIIPGSGPTDRDGNNPTGVAAQTYKLLAEALAAQGIASVRIDKRGMFESADAIPDPNKVTVEDYVADIESWAATISARNDEECVWLLGHSEGGLHAMAAAAKAPDAYCGLLLVASPGRNTADVIRAQIAANPAATPLLPQVDGIIARLKAGESVPADEIHPGLLALFAPQVQGFVSSLFQQEPAELIAAHDLPVLIVNGREDIQTPAADAETLAESREDATLVLLGGVNHVLKEVPEGDRAANLASYADPDLPIAPGVVEAVVAFVLDPM